MSTTFWAKPDQTYEEHVEAAYKAWKQTIEAMTPLIVRLAKQKAFAVDRFLMGSLLSVTLHDIGKMIQPFQEMMDCVRRKKPFDKRKNYRHELVSFVFAAKYWYLINQGNHLATIPLEALAVVGHHKALDSDLTSFMRESTMPRPQLIAEGIDQAVCLAEELFGREGYALPSLPRRNGIEDPFNSLAALILRLDKGILIGGADRSRSIYALLKAILHYADWHGSGRQSVVYSVSKDISAIVNDIRERCEKRGIPFSGLTSFQADCGNTSGHVVAMAPTGSGKTEASILWALRNAEEMGGAKMIYLLPTMVTANSIRNRLAAFFGDQDVGLTHSTANLFLDGGQSIQEEEDVWENRRDVLFDQSFIKPVTVGTVDQLLTSGFNSGRWTLKEANASNAVIIIDEIHAYDGWTLGLIVSMIRHLSAMGTRFMLMSATLPERLRQMFAKELDADAFITDNSVLDATRSRYFVVEEGIEDHFTDVAQAIQDGRRALVVTNTVESCQNMAELLADLNPVCYHSRFILKDRKEIEERIERAGLVVATQVIEVSLDIDYDWLFTECAPPDAIAQRAGRINRYRDDSRDSRVFIFRASDKGKKVYNPVNDPTLLARSFEAFRRAPSMLTEKDLVRIVDEVYKETNTYGSDPFVDAMQQFKLSQKNRMMILDSRIRDEKQEVTRQTKYETTSVIPLCFKEEVMGLAPSGRRWYEVKLPLWYVMRNKQEVDGLTFCDVDYDPHFGARLKRDEPPGSMIF